MRSLLTVVLALLTFGVFANPDIRDNAPLQYDKQRSKADGTQLEFGGGGYIGGHFAIPGSVLVYKQGLPYQTYEEREFRGGACYTVRTSRPSGNGTGPISHHILACQNVRVYGYKQNPNPACIEGYECGPDTLASVQITDRYFPCYYRGPDGGTDYLDNWWQKWRGVSTQEDGSVLVDEVYLDCW